MMMTTRTATVMRWASAILFVAGVVASGLWMDRGYPPVLGAAVACLAIWGILLILLRGMR